MKSKTMKLIGGGILIIILAYSLIKYKSNVQDLKNQMFFTTGKIESTQIGKSNYFIIYRFNYQNELYSEYKSIFGTSFKKANSFLVGKSFPVLVSKKNQK